ncbi:hyaluronidase B-like isoform X3 [Diorhabda carinulata]|uniref:hyaluronidase B-like isoform X3 n=1 Tax=Diorhabda carinulata TaxID=1163345 RepID=UPI0025A27761|nr:hyaluronidase B-like isoform X3 [Diorhabda carinulata]
MKYGVKGNREEIPQVKDINLEHPVIIRSNKQKQINAYWNIPTFQCDSHKLNFSALAEKYGIVQNDNDRFRGKFINILYDPGDFPAILKTGTKTVLRNGGVPQEGNLTRHLKIFENILNQLIPDESFSGIGIIDFESWRPIFRQNFGKLDEYKSISIAIEKEKHPFWTKNLLIKEATQRFEDAAKIFMAQTLLIAKRSRPKATWGYYAYPYCFNMSPNNMKQTCPPEVVAENGRYIRSNRKSTFKRLRAKRKLKWLFQLTDNFYPSVYIGNSSYSMVDKIKMVKGRINESIRIRNSLNVRKNIILYFWFKYQDTNKFLSKEDLLNLFTVISKSNIDGVVIWGSSNDVNTKQKCLELHQYIDDVLGPILSHILVN